MSAHFLIIIKHIVLKTEVYDKFDAHFIVEKVGH